MHKILLRTIPLASLLCLVACDVDDETVTRSGDGILGAGLSADESEFDELDVDELADAIDPAFACSDAGWNTSWTNLENQVLTLVNQRRAAGASCGGVWRPPVPNLTSDSRLRCAARNHSRDMANKNYFSHTSLDGRTFRTRIEAAGYKPWLNIGENIAAGQTTASAVVNGWMASTGHCNNIMSANFKHIGIGYAYNVNATYDHYWTQDFGRQ